MTVTSEHTIVVRKVLRATPKEVYAAWTEPSLMSRWLAKKVEADVRVGGRYRNVVGEADGVTYVHQGEYRVLESERRIVQTFQGGPDEPSSEPSPYTDETIEVLLEPHGATDTELTFINGWNGKGMNAEEREALLEAWTRWLAGLDKLFSG